MIIRRFLKWLFELNRKPTVYHSPQDIDTCLDLIKQANAKGWKPFDRHNVSGQIDGKRFWLRAKAFWYRSFGPVLHGKMTKDPVGTKIEVTFAMHPFVFFQTVLALVLVHLFVLGLSVNAARDHLAGSHTLAGAPGEKTLVIITLLFLVPWVGLSLMRLRAQLDKRSLIEFLTVVLEAKSKKEV